MDELVHEQKKLSVCSLRYRTKVFVLIEYLKRTVELSEIHVVEKLFHSIVMLHPDYVLSSVKLLKTAWYIIKITLW